MENRAMASILIADQSPALRRAAQFLFESLGHACVGTRDYMETLDLVKGMSPDLVIIDARLSEYRGISVVEAIRDLSGLRQPCIFFVTEKSDPASVRAALEAGADDFLMKPFDRELVAFKLAQAKARGKLVERPQRTRLVQDNSSSWRFRTFGRAV
tara:strand:+ start:9888 stop:10355 length:468 start_codon:yes stop_codon:yes gene_type:complete